MPHIDWTGVRDRVIALGDHPDRGKVFGSIGHRFQLEPPLTEDEVRGLEGWLGIALPEDYRGFLTHVGAGGAGPFYGIFPVRRNDDGSWSWDGDGGEMTDATRMSDPFPVDRILPETLSALEEERPDEDQFDDLTAFDEAMEQWQERLDAVLGDPGLTAGAICLAHEGCAYRDWLVVSGPERGNMWEDPRCDDLDLAPRTTPERERITFGEWYLAWLTTAEASTGAAR